MIAPPGPARVREDENLLGARHEGVCFSKIGTGRSPLDALVPARIGQEPAAAACYLGDLVGAEMPDDRVERARDRRHGAELLDEFFPRADCLLRMNGMAGVIEHEF
jgi:hypothetical protein